MKKLLQTLCLVFFASVLAACGGDSPEKTAKTFFEELFSGDASKAAELVYIPPEAGDKGAEMAKGKLTMMAGELQKKVKEEGGVTISTGEVNYTNADKTEATVELIMTKKKDNKQKTEKVPLIKTDKGWRIQMK
jgi:hypothetical protein